MDPTHPHRSSNDTYPQRQQQQQQPQQQPQQQSQQQQPQPGNTPNEPVHCFWALMTYGDLRFIYLSSSVQRAVSAKYKQLLGQSFFDYIHPDEAKLARKDLNAFMDVHNLYGSVTRCRFKNVCPEWKLRKQSRAPGSTNAPTAAALQAAASEGGLSSRGLGQNGLQPSDGTMDGKSALQENGLECKDYEDIFPNGEEDEFIILDVVMNVVSDEVVLGFFHIDGQGLYKGFWSNGICGESKESLPTLAPEIMRHLQDSVRAKAASSQLAGLGLDTNGEDGSSPPSSPLRPRYENNKTKRIFQIYDSHNRNLLLTWPQPGPISSGPGTMAYNPDLYTQIVKSHHIPSDALENTTCLKRFCSKHALPNVSQLSSQDASYQVESVFIPYGHIIFACFQTSPSTSVSHWNTSASPNTLMSSAQNAYLSSPSPGTRLFASQIEGSPSDPLSNLSSMSGSTGHLSSALFGTGGSGQGSPSSALNSPLVIPSLPSLSPFLKHAVPGQVAISPAQASPSMTSGPLRGQTVSNLSQSTLYHPYKTNNGVASSATPTSAAAANLPLPESMQESLSFLSDYKIGEHDRSRGDSAGGRSTSGSSDSQSMWHASTPHPAIAAMVGHALSPSSPSFQRSVGTKDTKSHDRQKSSLDGSLSGNERERKIQKVSASPRHPAHDAVIRKKSMSSTSTGSSSPPSQRDMDSSELSGQEYGSGGGGHGVMRIQQEEKACESCGTTNSPEWRRGQSGKKDLCNACGLRYSRSVARLNRQAQKQLEGKANGKVKGPKSGKPPKSGTKKSTDSEFNQDQQQQQQPQQQQQLQQQQHQQQQHQQQPQQQANNNPLQQMHQQFQQHSSGSGAFPSMFTTTPVPPPSFYPGS
ncbi:hypothetical protein EMPS_09683 [Entomortierella parvispora]|uniref:GATA-type domain-containing protein n=1 Tax=Entomortierella parvispora TaxID=205924 RepID=A0A9P3HIG3_9FUNG|nr:hypothetical protein EMPS_09683 [Entomortierella parvispora]